MGVVVKSLSLVGLALGGILEVIVVFLLFLFSFFIIINELVERERGAPNRFDFSFWGAFGLIKRSHLL